MRYRSRPKRNLSSADSCIYVMLLLLVLQNAGSDTGESRTSTETSTKSGAILLRRSLSLEKRAVGRDAVTHGSGYLPPAEFSLRLCTN